MESSPAHVIAQLCRQLYDLGWVTGTGGGISIREAGRVYMAPSGVQKERIEPGDIYVLDEAGSVLEGPTQPGLKPSECAPLFYNAFRLRDAGAVIHSHGIYAMLATLISEETFECTEIEMIKGLSGHGYYDRVCVPIIENTAHECDLADRMARAIEDYPKSHAVLVRRHGVYIWGRDWTHAKTQAECYHYLFEAAVRMRQLGLSASKGTSAGAEHEAARPLGTIGGKR